MKKIILPLVIFLMLLVLFTVLITVFLFHDFSQQIEWKAFQSVALKFGLRFAFALSVLTMLTGYAFKKIKNKIFLSLVAVCCVAILCFLYYEFHWYVGIYGLIEGDIFK